MKVLLLTILLAGLVYAQSPELMECLEAKCPDQYSKCLANANCEDKLRKGANDCGEKVNLTCWSKYVLFNTPAQNVCYCAVDNGCLAEGSEFDQLAVSLAKKVRSEVSNLRSQ